MNQYLEMGKRHQEEINNFPMFFAFSKKQFAEGMAEFGLTEKDINKIYSIGGGGYILKIDSEKLQEIFERNSAEMVQAMKNKQFVFDMFNYELANHEFNYTGSVDDTLDSLGLTQNKGVRLPAQCQHMHYDAQARSSRRSKSF